MKPVEQELYNQIIARDFDEQPITCLFAIDQPLTNALVAIIRELHERLTNAKETIIKKNLNE